MSVDQKERGRYNSSKTRVEPTFDVLREHFREFFTLVPCSRIGGLRLPDWDGGRCEIRYGTGEDSRGGGEKSLPPQVELLKLLIKRMDKDAAPQIVKKPGQGGNLQRRNLYFKRGDYLALREKALNELDRAATSEEFSKRRGYPREWFVLEGSTRPDVYIRTNQFILLIEGKRTEPEFKRSTTWMRHRDQMIRHMDSLYPVKGKPGLPIFGLYILSDGTDPAFGVARGNRKLKDGIEWYDDLAHWKLSLPHRTDEAVIEEMQQHFLGYMTWEEIARKFPLVEETWNAAEKALVDQNLNR